MDEWREVRLGDIASIVGGGTPSTKNPENYNGHITQEELDSSSAGLMSSQQSNEGKIRRTMIERDAVDAMVALPGQLFYSTQIPACLWILAKDKTANGHRDRRGEILFIDARDLGYMADRVRREFSDEDIAKIADTYHHWRNKDSSEAYQDIPGFCKSTSLDEIKENNFVLTPGWYVRNRWRNQTNWTTKSKRASGSFRSVEMGMLFADGSSEPSLLTGLTIKKETPSRANARTCDTTQSRRGAIIHIETRESQRRIQLSYPTSWTKAYSIDLIKIEAKEEFRK
ncbi:MAG: N-6 DNA methylase [Gammaproteobacteria bacterium AqS3]|nr:N-6 DNA methylase [Gammaproteobacteria bacterium AqS3]